MDSRNPSTPSPPSSPPASLLIETIDHRNTTAQPIGEQSHDLSSPDSPTRSDSDRTITRTASPASTDRTITRRNFVGPAQPQSRQPTQNHPPPTFPAITDRVDFPTAALPALANYEQQYHPIGLFNWAHLHLPLHLRIGRDLVRGSTNTMEPAPPARVVQRNDFNWPIPNGDPKDNVASDAASTSTTSTAATPATGASGAGEEASGLLGAAMKPTFPPNLEGVVAARQKTQAKATEDLAGLGPELEAALLAKRAYNEKFGAFRTRWTKTQFALADEAKKMRARRLTGAEMRPVVGAIGVMFALGKAVDLAAFPGWGFGEFDEEACSPEGYLVELFPEFTSNGTILPQQWDFSLGGIMAGEKRDLLPTLWAAAVAGQWEAVDEMTSGALAVAEKFLGGV